VRRRPRTREPLRDRPRGAGRGAVADRVADAAARLGPDARGGLRRRADPVPLQGRRARQRELARDRLRRAPHSRHPAPAARDRHRALDAGCAHRLAVAGAVVAELKPVARDERGLTLTELAVVMILGTMIMAGFVGFYLSSQGMWLDS